MTSPIVRLYETEQQAGDALRSLEEAGFAPDTMQLLVPVSKSDTGSAGAVANAVRAGFVPQERADVYADGVQQGHSLLAIRAPFGHGQLAIDILDRFDPVDTGLEHPVPAVAWDVAAPFSSGLQAPVLLRGSPAPLSRLLGRPPLSRGRTFERKYAELTSPDWTFSSLLGLRLLSRRAKPWSSLTGRSGADWTRSFGLPLLSGNATAFSTKLGLGFLSGPLRYDQPAPFSAGLGVPTASRRRSVLSRLFGELVSPRFALFGRGALSSNPTPLSSLVGQPLLLQDPAPLSSKIGQPLLSPGHAPLSSKLGLPVLAHNPAPLSSLLCLRVLSPYQ